VTVFPDLGSVTSVTMGFRAPGALNLSTT
jgi:hypothetical protein